jgi:hypothetical protein
MALNNAASNVTPLAACAARSQAVFAAPRTACVPSRRAARDRILRVDAAGTAARTGGGTGHRIGDDAPGHAAAALRTPPQAARDARRTAVCAAVTPHRLAAPPARRDRPALRPSPPEPGSPPMIRALALCLALVPAPVLACAVEEPFAITDIAEGPVVVVGDVSAYVRDGLNEGHFRLAVTEVLAGAGPDMMEARWPLLMAEFPPETWDRPTRVVAAFYPPVEGSEYLLVVEMCGKAHLAEATGDNLAAVRGALTQ